MPSSLRSVLVTRRVAPVALVGVGLLIAEATFGTEPLGPAHTLLMLLGFVAIAPASWRWLIGSKERSGIALAVRLLGYGATGALYVMLAGWALPVALRMQPTLLTDGPGLFVTLALVWAGGWGLGRELELSDALSRAHLRERELARAAEHAQLLALRRNLDPHFLYNTLNAIAEWCREDPETAERAILELARLLRALFEAAHRDRWPLSREVEIVRALWALHHARDPSRFTPIVNVDDIEMDVPPLLLLPLAENAMTHGVLAGHRGDVELWVTANEDDVDVLISNPGADERPPQEGRGHGLQSTLQRLAMSYEGRASLTVSREDGHTSVRVTLPRYPGGHTAGGAR